MSRRTETAYKAKSPGKSAQHDEVPGFTRYGKCCGCVVTVHVLIRGDLFAMQLEKAAPWVATSVVIKEESAEAIVAANTERRAEGVGEEARWLSITDSLRCSRKRSSPIR